MVALIEPSRQSRPVPSRPGPAGPRPSRSQSRRSQSSRSRSGGADLSLSPDPAAPGARPALRLIVSPDPAAIPARPAAAPLSPPGRERLPVAAVVAMGVVGVFGLVFGLRAIQGSPPAGTWSEVVPTAQAVAPAPVGPGDQIYRVVEGDTLWSIALAIAPDRDPREVTAVLRNANGGSSQLLSGQTLVIPADLVR